MVSFCIVILKEGLLWRWHFYSDKLSRKKMMMDFSKSGNQYCDIMYNPCTCVHMCVLGRKYIMAFMKFSKVLPWALLHQIAKAWGFIEAHFTHYAKKGLLYSIPHSQGEAEV